jgi:hypothetical protein
MDNKNPYPSIFVGFDSAELLKSYPIPEGVAAVAFLAREYKVKSVEKIPDGQLNAEKWKSLLETIDAKLVDKTLAPVIRPRLKPRAPVAEPPAAPPPATQ